MRSWTSITMHDIRPILLVAIVMLALTLSGVLSACGGPAAKGSPVYLGRNYQSPVTVVVSANNSLNVNNAIKTYQCDGVNDYVEIQAAIDLVGDNPYHIKCLPGTYALGATTLDLLKNITSSSSGITFDFRGAIFQYSGNNSAISINGSGSDWLHKDSHFYGGIVQATGDAKTSTNATAVYVKRFGYGNSISFQTKDFLVGTALKLDSEDGTPILFTECNEIDLTALDCKYGIVFDGDTSCNYNKIKRFRFTPGTIDGAIGISRATGSTADLHGLHIVDSVVWFSGNDQVGFDFENADQISIDYAGFEQSAGTNATGIRADNTVYDINLGSYSHVGNVTMFDITRNINQPIGGLQNLISNGGFEVGDSPIGWTATRSTIAQDTVTVKEGDASINITCNDAGATGVSYTYAAISDYAYYKNRTVTLGAWVQAPSSNDQDQAIGLSDGTFPEGYSEVIPKDDEWHWRTVTYQVSNSATRLWAVGRAKASSDNDTDDVLYMDGAIVVEGNACPSFSPKPSESLASQTFVVDVFQFPNPGTDWTPELNGAGLAANLTAKKMWMPLDFLKIGDYIESYKLVGDVTEADTLTLDCRLVKVNKADPITTTNVTGGGITQIDANGNFDTSASLTSPEIIATDKSYKLEITGTTGAGDSITVMHAEIVVYRN